MPIAKSNTQHVSCCRKMNIIYKYISACSIDVLGYVYRIQAQWGYASLQHVSFLIHTYIWPFAVEWDFHRFADIFSRLHYQEQNHFVILLQLSNNTIAKHLEWWATLDGLIRDVLKIPLPLYMLCLFKRFQNFVIYARSLQLDAGILVIYIETNIVSQHKRTGTNCLRLW